MFLLVTSMVTNGQLTLSNTSLNFGVVTEIAPDSLPLTIRNESARPVLVSDIRFYNTYGAPAFSTRYEYFSIAAADSVTIWIVFAPRHNIFHNSEMVIFNDGLRGHLSVDLKGQGRFSKSYYAGTENKEQQILKDSLRAIISANYLSLGYSVGRDSMFMIYDNKFINGQGASQNTIECVYTGREAIGYADRTDCQNNYSFNTEHTFPQSFFNSMEPMRSDLFHLFPTDNLANNQRGDNPFGIVNNPTWTSGGSKATNMLFEPRDAVKGKMARALLYFVLRWQDYSNFVNPQETLLRGWHTSRLPDAVEKKRNDDIFRIQQNRNPFIDYPQFIERISSICNTASAPIVNAIDITEDTIIYGQVTTNTDHLFNLAVVNTGNTAVSISNLSLSNNIVFSFASGGSDTTIAPGDALNIRINCNTSSGNPVRAFLNFNTSVGSAANNTIPIFVNDSVFTNVSEIIQQELTIFPNPAIEQISIAGFKGKLFCMLTDITGKVILEKQLTEENATIQLHGISPGVYFLKTNEGVKRVIVQ